MALSILRLISEDARKDRTARIIVQLPVDVATYLINEKREALRALEDKGHAQLVLVPNPHIQTPEYSIRRVRDDETTLPENAQVSYQIPAAPATVDPVAEREKRPAEMPAVAALLPRTAAPIVVPAPTPAPAPALALAPAAAAVESAQEATSGGFWGRVKRLFGTEQNSSAHATPAAQAPAQTEPQRDGSRGNGGNSGGGARRDGGRGRRPGRRPPDGARRDQPRRDAGNGRGGGERPREEPPRREPQQQPRAFESARAPDPSPVGNEIQGAAEYSERQSGPPGSAAMDRPRSGRSRRGGRRRRRGGGGGNREPGTGPNGPAEGGALPSVPNYSWGEPEPQHDHENEHDHDAGRAGEFNGGQAGSASAPADSEVRGAGQGNATPSEHKPSMAWSSAPPAEPAPTTPHPNE